MTFITIMNASSYFGMNQDWAMTILPMTGSIACFLVFCYMLVKGVFEKPTDEDLYMLLLGVVAILAWKYQSATFAHFVIIATFSIAVLPILRDVLEDPANEDPTPWSLWCHAFAIGIVVVLLRSHHLITDLIYPWGCFVGHASLTFITKRAHAQAAKELENSKTKTVTNL
ncbi:MAG: hypothetical protein HY226_02230 [Candidatus Vogelbacteria bacterium]|nr:hypothetical protein [Candidatus Vogelbacteria bacterium]